MKINRIGIRKLVRYGCTHPGENLSTRFVTDCNPETIRAALGEYVSKPH
jgi:hypothetical protein